MRHWFSGWIIIGSNQSKHNKQSLTESQYKRKSEKRSIVMIERVASEVRYSRVLQLDL